MAKAVPTTAAALLQSPIFAMADVQFSIPDSVRSQIAEMADREGLTIEQFVAAAVAERVVRLSGMDTLRQEVSTANEQDFRRYLDLIPSTPAAASDKLPTA
jgi:hypothetical protein